jgi:hypothetical protein
MLYLQKVYHLAMQIDMQIITKFKKKIVFNFS